MIPVMPTYYDSPSSGDEAIGAVAAVFLILFYVALFAFSIYLYMRIARKAGWPPAYGLLVFIPLANIVFMIMFVFQEWPVERRLREAEARLAMLGGGYGQPGYGQAGYDQAGYGQAGTGHPAFAPQAYGDQAAAPHGTDPYAAPVADGTAPYGAAPYAAPPAAPYGAAPAQDPWTAPPVPQAPGTTPEQGQGYGQGYGQGTGQGTAGDPWTPQPPR